MCNVEFVEDNLMHRKTLRTNHTTVSHVIDEYFNVCKIYVVFPDEFIDVFLHLKENRMVENCAKDVLLLAMVCSMLSELWIHFFFSNLCEMRRGIFRQIILRLVPNRRQHSKMHSFIEWLLPFNIYFYYNLRKVIP